MLLLRLVVSTSLFVSAQVPKIGDVTYSPLSARGDPCDFIYYLYMAEMTKSTDLGLSFLSLTV